MLRVSDSAVSTWALAFREAKRIVAFPLSGQRSATRKRGFRSQYLAWRSPGTEAQHVRLFTGSRTLAGSPKVDGYSFLRKKTFHSLSKTGFIPAQIP